MARVPRSLESASERLSLLLLHFTLIVSGLARRKSYDWLTVYDPTRWIPRIAACNRKLWVLVLYRISSLDRIVLECVTGLTRAAWLIFDLCTEKFRVFVVLRPGCLEGLEFDFRGRRRFRRSFLGSVDRESKNVPLFIFVFLQLVCR